jgi:hypothetical protein
MLLKTGLSTIIIAEILAQIEPTKCINKMYQQNVSTKCINKMYQSHVAKYSYDDRMLLDCYLHSLLQSITVNVVAINDDHDWHNSLRK